jgi:hypothetical protein
MRLESWPICKVSLFILWKYLGFTMFLASFSLRKPPWLLSCLKKFESYLLCSAPNCHYLFVIFFSITICLCP